VRRESAARNAADGGVARSVLGFDRDMLVAFYKAYEIRSNHSPPVIGADQNLPIDPRSSQLQQSWRSLRCDCHVLTERRHERGQRGKGKEKRLRPYLDKLCEGAIIVGDIECTENKANN
jgi:hypothetical protein